jgi:DNA-binding transcriptional ArsR family regulator
VYIAIGEPTRRRLLDSLGHGERNVTDLARPFRMTRAAVSQHLRILLDSGLVTARKVGRERRYRLRAAPLREVYDWVEHYKKFWTEKLTALSKYLNREAQKLRKQENTEAKEPAD